MFFTATSQVFLLSLVCQALAVFNSNQCLNGLASYNDTSGRCNCNQGYKGRGDLCCDDVDAWSNCNVGGDPWLSTYDGTQSALNFLCTGRIAVVDSETSTGDSCKVELWLSSRTVDKGAIYPDGMTVAYSIANRDKVLFKFVKGTLQRPSDAVPQPASALYRSRLNRNSIQGESININYDFTREIWSLTGCGTKVAFRAVRNDRSVHETYRPGVCFSYKNNYKAKPTGNIAEGDLCSVSSAYNPSGSLASDLLSHLVGDLSNIGEEAQSVHPDYKGACRKLGDVANVQCSGKNLASPSLKCAPMLYNSVVRACLNAKGATGLQMLNWFSECLSFQCNPDRTRCAIFLANNDALKVCVPSFCDL